MDPITAGIGAVSSAAGNIFNIGSQRRENRRQRDFSREMYDRQHKDNIQFWNMQNEYNTPSQQMSRYADAGLNPHLIYGQTNTAGPISSSTTPTGPSTTAARIDFDPLSEFAKALNLQMMSEQVSSQKLSNDLKALELEDERWERRESGTAEIGSPQDSMYIAPTEALYRQKKRRELDLANQSLANAVADERRINAITGQTISQQQLQNIQSSMQGLEVELAKKGIFRGDDAYQRIIMEMTDDNTLRSIAIGSPAAIGTIIKTILDRSVGRKIIRGTK